MTSKKDSSILNDIKSALETIKNITDPAMRLAMIDALISAFGSILPNEVLAVIQQAKLDAINESLNLSKSAKESNSSISPLSRPEIGGLFEGLALNVLGGIKAISPEKASEIASKYSDFMSDITEMGMLGVTNLIDMIHEKDHHPKKKDISDIHSTLKEVSPDSYIIRSAEELESAIRSAKRDIVSDAKKGKSVKFSDLSDETKADLEKVSKLSEKAENLLNTRKKMTLNEELASLRSELGEGDTKSFSSKFFSEKKKPMVDKVISEERGGAGLPAKK